MFRIIKIESTIKYKQKEFFADYSIESDEMGGLQLKLYQLAKLSIFSYYLILNNRKTLNFFRPYISKYPKVMLKDIGSDGKLANIWFLIDRSIINYNLDVEIWSKGLEIPFTSRLSQYLNKFVNN